jgi:hypothetical protein
MAEVARIDFESIERPYIIVNLAGEEKHLPITFDSEDMEIVGGAADAGEGFKKFFAKYLGDVVYQLGDNQLSRLLKVWNEQRGLLNEPDLGES